MSWAWLAKGWFSIVRLKIASGLEGSNPFSLFCSNCPVEECCWPVIGLAHHKLIFCSSSNNRLWH